MLSFMKENGLNAYIYAPKDDPYHRSKWRELYPDNLQQELEKISKFARTKGVQFIFAVSPGLDLKFDGAGAEADKKAMLDKLNIMYNSGVRQFAVFFDDIEKTDAKGRVDFLNFIDNNFIKVKPGTRPLIMVPTEYSLKDMEKNGEISEYTRIMSEKLNRDIIVLSTGNGVCPDGLREEDILALQRYYPHRKVGIWWNYPVNDFMKDKPALGPLDKMTGENDIEAFFMNPMELEQLSKIAIATGADYARNPAGYDERKSWEKSLADQYGNLAYDMMIFAGENQRLENSWANIGHADDKERDKLYYRLDKAREKGDIPEQKRLIGLLLEDTKARIEAYSHLLKALPAKILTECSEKLENGIRKYSIEQKCLEGMAENL